MTADERRAVILEVLGEVAGIDAHIAETVANRLLPGETWRYGCTDADSFIENDAGERAMSKS
jgi:hypothetical protein